MICNMSLFLYKWKELLQEPARRDTQLLTSRALVPAVRKQGIRNHTLASCQPDEVQMQ